MTLQKTRKYSLGKLVVALSALYVLLIASFADAATTLGSFGVSTDVPVAGDWNGNRTSKIGTFRQGKWYLDNGDAKWVSGVDVLVNNFGQKNDTPVSGDWNGDGVTDLGAFRGGKWYLDSDGTRGWSKNDTVISSFGLSGDLPVAGDWNGDGKSDVGAFRAGKWYLDSNGNRGWDSADNAAVFTFGLAGDIPVSGDWNSDGIADAGVFRAGKWYLDSNGNRAWDSGDIAVITFGQAGDLPVTGDWNGDGKVELGLFRQGTWMAEPVSIASQPVVDTTAPTVSILSPASGANYTSAQTVTVSVSALDNVGVSKVELYDGAALKGVDSAAPFSFAWAIASSDNGSHGLTAKAYDTAGNVSSTTVGITVNISTTTADYVAPVLNSVAVSNGSYLLNWSLPETAYGTPAGGYDVFVDGVDDNLHHTTLSVAKSSLPLNIEHCFKVEARWTQAVPAVFSASNQICVQPSDATAPTVSITAPSAGASYSSVQSVTIAVSAQDNNGVSKVELYDNGVLKGTDTVAPYSFSWAVDQNGNGSHSLTAKAYDAAGNIGTSSVVGVAVNIPVSDTSAPTVSIISPVTGTTVDSTQLVTVTVSAQDNIGVAKVEFYDGNILKSTDTSSPFTYDWSVTSATNGTHVLSCKAFDAAGNVQTSNSVTVVVDIAATVPSGPLKVFPAAKGFGVESPAGRGGQIIKVTNLNDSGPGSLRAAVAASGPRIVVFEVSGRIKLASPLTISNPFITIAGQTAPSPGIQITDRVFIVQTHDVLVQHIRFRIGDEGKLDNGSWDAEDAIRVYGSNAYNIVFDHITANWSIDDIIDFTNSAHDVTVSNSIFAEPLANSVHTEVHPYISLIAYGSYKIFYYGNLFMSGGARQPYIREGQAGLANNLFYNSINSEFTAISSSEAAIERASLVNNVYKSGPSGAPKSAIAIGSATSPGSEIYISGNTYDGGATRSGSTAFDVNSPPANTWPNGLTVLNTSLVENYVIANAGARPKDRDTVESRLVNEVMSYSGHVIDSQAQVGGFPVYPLNVRTFNPGSNPSGDDDGDGYTNIEEILHQMSNLVE